MNNINKSVICIILGIIFIAVFIGLRNSFAEKTNTVEIIQDGNIIYTLDLNKSKDELIQVEFQGHKNIIQIKDKQISIIEADCPDKTCVNMGILKSAFTPIVCLPNHLVIQYVNDDKEIDAMQSLSHLSPQTPPHCVLPFQRQARNSQVLLSVHLCAKYNE